MFAEFKAKNRTSLRQSLSAETSPTSFFFANCETVVGRSEPETGSPESSQGTTKLKPRAKSVARSSERATLSCESPS